MKVQFFIAVLVLCVTVVAQAALLPFNQYINTSSIRTHGMSSPNYPPPCTEPLGTMLWSKYMVDPNFFEPDFADFSLSENNLLLATHYSAYAVNAQTGNMFWNRTWDSSKVRKKVPSVYETELVYFTTGVSGAEDTTLFINNGSTAWSFNAQTNGGWTANPKIAQNRMFTFTGQAMYGLDARTGTLLWRLWFQNETACTNRVDSGVSLFVMGNAEIIMQCYAQENMAVIIKVDGITGKQVWKSDLFPIANGMPSGTLCSDGTVYATQIVGTDRQWLVGVDYRTGAVVYNITIEDSIGQGVDNLTTFFLVLISSNDNGLFYVSPNYFYRANCKTGATVWKQAVYAPNNLITLENQMATPYLTEGQKRLVIGGGNSFFVLSAVTGDILWTYLTTGQIWSDPLVAQNRLFAASENGYLYSFCLGVEKDDVDDDDDNNKEEIIIGVVCAGVCVIAIVMLLWWRKKKNSSFGTGGGGGGDGEAAKYTQLHAT